jgi:hypothetical protein
VSQNRPHDSFDPGRSGEFPRSVDESTYAASLPLVRYGTTAIRAMSSMRPGAIYRALSALLTVEGAPVLAVVVGLLMARFGPGAGLHEISLTALVPPTANPGVVVLAGVSVLSVLSLLRGVLDAAAYTSIRSAVEGGDGPRWRDTRARIPTYVALALAQFSVVAAGMMFAMPLANVIWRERAELGSDVRLDLLLAASVGLVVFIQAATQFVMAIARGHAVWRHTFFAATIATAVAAPARDIRIFGRLLLGWTAARTFFVNVGAWFVYLAADAVSTMVSPVGLALRLAALVAVAVAAWAVMMWFDAVMVAVSGQRLGDLSWYGGRLQRPRRDASDPALEPPVAGWYGAEGDPSVNIFGYDQVLGLAGEAPTTAEPVPVPVVDPPKVRVADPLAWLRAWAEGGAACVDGEASRLEPASYRTAAGTLEKVRRGAA